MNLGFFDKFTSPCLLGIPLIFISMLFPALLLPSPDNQGIHKRLCTLQLWFFQ